MTSPAKYDWKVLRHDGEFKGLFGGYRTVLSHTEEKARTRYDELVRTIHKGGVRLVNPEGVIDAEYVAPRPQTQ